MRSTTVIQEKMKISNKRGQHNRKKFAIALRVSVPVKWLRRLKGLLAQSSLSWCWGEKCVILNSLSVVRPMFCLNMCFLLSWPVLLIISIDRLARSSRQTLYIVLGPSRVPQRDTICRCKKRISFSRNITRRKLHFNFQKRLGRKEREVVPMHWWC